MRNPIIREIFIVILLTFVIIITLRIVLFDFIPNKKTLPEPIRYQADATVKTTLKEITLDEKSEDAESSKKESVLKSYTIEESDLKNYVSKKDYESGKEDPFDDYIEKEQNTINKNSNKR